VSSGNLFGKGFFGKICVVQSSETALMLDGGFQLRYQQFSFAEGSNEGVKEELPFWVMEVSRCV
jgi:hypothetical protein